MSKNDTKKALRYCSLAGNVKQGHLVGELLVYILNLGTNLQEVQRHVPDVVLGGKLEKGKTFMLLVDVETGIDVAYDVVHGPVLNGSPDCHNATWN